MARRTKTCRRDAACLVCSEAARPKCEQRGDADGTLIALRRICASVALPAPLDTAKTTPPATAPQRCLLLPGSTSIATDSARGRDAVLAISRSSENIPSIRNHMLRSSPDEQRTVRRDPVLSDRHRRFPAQAPASKYRIRSAPERNSLPPSGQHRSLAPERRPLPRPPPASAWSPRYRKSRSDASRGVWQHAHTAQSANPPRK